MAAGTTPLTKTLDRIHAQAAAQAGITAARAFKGYKRWTDTEDFLELVRALTAENQGYFWVRIAGVNSEGSLQKHVWEFEAELAVYVPKDTTTDLNSAWDFAHTLAAALEDESAYGDGEHVPRVSYALRKVDTLEKASVALFGFGHGGLGRMQVIDP